MIESVRLHNFRSYKQANYAFSKKTNVIAGPNGSGKTNLIEAIIVGATGKSYRASDLELIKDKSDWLRIDMSLSDSSVRTIKISKDQNRAIKTIHINGKNYTRITQSSKIPVVVFEPNQLQIISGSPDKRRDYLDNIIMQQVHGYYSTTAKYKKALTQRNNLLKQGVINPSHIFPWDLRLSKLGGEITKQRTKYLEDAAKLISDTYKIISGTKDVARLIYKHTWPIETYESSFFKSLEKSIETDKNRGFTTTGPHREDINLLINDRNVQTKASRGEARSLLFTLKIVELKTLEEALNKKPILLLDDIFSELDVNRRTNLTKEINNYQVFITTTNADIARGQFTKPSMLIFNLT